LGEAGPPLYLVLQNVNYSDPTAPTTIQSLVEQVSALSRWIEPPVANWVADYAYWVTNQSQVFVRSNLDRGCPLPLGACARFVRRPRTSRRPPRPHHARFHPHPQTPQPRPSHR